MTAYLYDTGGNWVAHVPDGRNVWSRHGKWIGWFAYGDADVMTPKGKYLGTVVGDRLLHFTSHPYRGYPGYPGYPGYRGYPGYPGHAGHSGHIPRARDLRPEDYDPATYVE